MWSIRKSVAAGGAAMLLALMVAGPAGCGFRPLYGETTGSSAETLAAIRIDLIADRSGQVMRNMLLERLTPTGPPSHPAYALSVALTESKRELALRKDETATRANLTITASFVLRALRDPQFGMFSGAATSTNSYNVLQSDYATLGSESDARERALRQLSEEIRIRIAAALQNPQAFSRPIQRNPG